MIARRFAPLAAVSVLVTVVSAACVSAAAAPAPELPSPGTKAGYVVQSSPMANEPAVASDPEKASQAAGITVENYGESVLGTPLQAVTIGSGSTAVVVIGGLHTGLEGETVDIAESLRSAYLSGTDTIPEGVRLVFIVNANPDGYALNTRTNANGVDLNRNWPTADWSPWAYHSGEEVFAGAAALSEPETASLYHYLANLHPALVLSIHGYAGLVHYNSADEAAAFGETFAAAAGFLGIDRWDYYEITGELIQSMADLGIAAADIELAEDDFESFDRVRAGLTAVLQGLAPAG